MTDHPSLLNLAAPGAAATACEVGGVLVAALPPALAAMAAFPDCSPSPVSEIRPAATRGSLAAAAFLPRSKEAGEGWLAGLLAAWWEEGVEGVLAASSSPLCLQLLGLWRMSWSPSSYLYPHLCLSPRQMVEQFSPTHSWSDAPIKCLAWHPHTPKLAVAFTDDTVRVVMADPAATQPLLKFAGMKDVSSLAWQPCGASQLAVGCQAGVLVWTIDPASVVSRPSSSCVTRLVGVQGAVTSLAWSPDGRLLAACSPADTSLVVWSPASQAREVLHRRGGGGNTLVSWSPDSRRLFAATPGSTFRVWDTAAWTVDRWTVGGGLGRVAAAAWAPDGLQLVFATTDEPVLYSVSFREGSEGAVPVMDLGMVSLGHPEAGEGDGEEALGGLVQDIQWEPTGARLAVTFRDTPRLLLLRARPGALPGRLAPVGWVTGRRGERPAIAQFQRAPSALGALLTVAWSSGRLQHLPLVFGGPEVAEEAWQHAPAPHHALFSLPSEA